MKSTFVSFAALATLLAAAPAAHAALDAAMSIKGATQGLFTGSNTVKGRTGTSVVTAATDSMSSSTDKIAGVASGKRSHRPLVVTKPIDGASINLRTALVTNETLTTVTINFYRASASVTGVGASGAGDTKPYFTITLDNAHVTSIDFHHPDSHSTQPDVKNQSDYEEVSFGYQKITWTWADGGKAATDNWQQ